MIGAIAGDIIGSAYEHSIMKQIDFNLFTEKSTFTDDSVMTVAVASVLLDGGSFVNNLQQWGRRYPNAGYGFNFFQWIHDDLPQPYNSWGNGSAMRVSPVGFAFNELQDVLVKAKESAEVSHNHPEGIKGAQATALAIFMGRNGFTKGQIKESIESNFGYDLGRKLEEIRKTYVFDVSCQGSVPESIIAFLESTDYESAIRLAVSLGGDSDTQACNAGGIAEAYYKEIPSVIISETRKILPNDLLGIVERFEKRWPSYRVV